LAEMIPKVKELKLKTKLWWL